MQRHFVCKVWNVDVDDDDDDVEDDDDDDDDDDDNNNNNNSTLRRMYFQMFINYIQHYADITCDILTSQLRTEKIGNYLGIRFVTIQSLWTGNCTPVTVYKMV